MKSLNYITFLLLFCSLIAYSQSKSTFYYTGKGEKIPLTLDREHIYVVAETQNLEKTMRQVFRSEAQILKSGFTDEKKTFRASPTKSHLVGYNWAEVKLPKTTSSEGYKQKITSLIESKSFDFVVPYYRSNLGEKVGLTQYFHIKLRAPEHVFLLEKMALSTGAEIIDKEGIAPLWYTLKCRKSTELNALELANKFYESGQFAVAEPNLILDFRINDFSGKTVVNSNSTTATTMEDYLDDQWGLNNTGQYGGIPGIDINAIRAWEIEIGSRNIKTAVIDQGFVDTKANGTIDVHYDLAENNYGRGYDPKTDGYSKVYGSHGVACAGIIGSQAKGTGGSTGIAHNSRLMSVSVNFEDRANSSMSLAKGIRWAADNGADIISNSWGAPRGTPVMVIDQAIEYALTSGRNGLGCVVVFSSGNENQGVSYPAYNNPKVLAVGAMSPCGERTNSSSCDTEDNGWGSNYGNSLDLVAPGTLITTTDRIGNNGYNPQTNLHTIAGGTLVSADYTNRDYTKVFNGTSAAAPFVSGVAALVLSVDPNLTGLEVNDILEKSATKVRKDLYSYTATSVRPNGTWNINTGYGLVNAFEALVLAKNCEVNDCCLFVHEGDLTLSSQEDIDNFEYCEVTGKLIITQFLSGNSTDITNLLGLSKLKKVGALEIRYTPKLNSLNGLEKLKTIDDSLVIGIANSTTPANGLLNLDGLSNLESVGGNILFTENDKLENINALSNITEIKGDLEIRYNNALIDLNGLSNLVSVGNKLILENNSILKDACGIYQLIVNENAVGGLKSISNNGPLTSTIEDIINSCKTCTTFIGDATITSQTDLDSFLYCEITGTLIISGNVANLSGLRRLAKIGGHLLIQNNPVLTNLAPLSKLNEIVGGLVIKNNPALTNISGLSSLSYIGQGMTISGNSALTDIERFNNMASINGNLTFYDNEQLQSIVGFSDVTTLKGNLTLTKNPALTDLSGFSNLETVLGKLYINNNDGLLHLDGFIGITSVGGDLILNGNNSLENACGIALLLKNVTAVTGTISVTSNTPPTNSIEVILDTCDTVCRGVYQGNYYFSSQEKIDTFTYCEVTGNVTIRESIQGDITNVLGLKVLQKIGGDLIIDKTHALQNLEGMSSLIELGNSIRISRNAVLTNVDDLNGINVFNSGSIKNLTITHNPTLTNVNGFRNIKKVSGGLHIHNNNALLQVDGFRNIEILLNGLTLTANSGMENACGIKHLLNPLVSISPITIHSNGPTSSTVQDIVDTCPSLFPGTPLEANKTQNLKGLIKLYPNPTNGSSISISGIQEAFSYHIMSLSGQLLEKGTVSKGEYGQQITFDNKLPSGVYFMEIRSATDNIVKKFVVE